MCVIAQPKVPRFSCVSKALVFHLKFIQQGIFNHLFCDLLVHVHCIFQVSDCIFHCSVNYPTPTKITLAPTFFFEKQFMFGIHLNKWFSNDVSQLKNVFQTSVGGKIRLNPKKCIKNATNNKPMHSSDSKINLSLINISITNIISMKYSLIYTYLFMLGI